MSNELKFQETREEPRQDVKPSDELADEQLDDVVGGDGEASKPRPTPPLIIACATGQHIKKAVL